MLNLKRISLFFTAIISLTFLFSCNTDTIKDLENRIAELENQAPDTVFVTSTDTLIITNTDTLYIANLDTLFIFDTVYLANDSVLIGDVRLFNQEMIDEFGASGIKKVVGRLEIQLEDETVSLLPMVNLESVVGNLNLYLSSNSLAGLDNLVSVTYLYISGISTLVGFPALADVEDLSIYGDNLTDLDGLQDITGIENFYLDVGKSFTSFQGFPLNPSSIKSLGISGGFHGNDNSESSLLTNLSGLEGLSFLNTLSISGFSELNDLSALGNISEVDKLILSFVPVLTDLNGLSSLEIINEQFRIGVGSQFESLAALTNVEIIGDVDIYLNAGYDNNGYPIPNTTLTSLNGLSKISGINSIAISGFEALSDISSLSNLPVELNMVSIWNTAITDLDPLAHITKFTGTHTYSSELMGMSIGSNPNLTDFCGIKTVMQYMENNSIDYYIEGNALNPQSSAEIVGCN